jgi:hypothetical protein
MPEDAGSRLQRSVPMPEAGAMHPAKAVTENRPISNVQARAAPECSHPDNTNDNQAFITADAWMSRTI